jgi:hypothetical protein
MEENNNNQRVFDLTKLTREEQLEFAHRLEEGLKDLKNKKDEQEK